MIRVVSFDADDTLYDFTAISRRALGKVAERMSEEISEMASPVSVDTVIGDLEETAGEMEHAYARIPDLRRTAFARTLARYGVRSPSLVEELNRTYVEHRFVAALPYDGAREILSEIGERYTVCVISNGEQDLEALGLDHLVDFVVTATDVGFQKPDPRIFQAAMARAGCAAREFVHVGDSLRSDVAGAKAAGAWAIWFNPSGLPRTGDVVPDKEIRKLGELLDALRELYALRPEGPETDDQ